MADRFPDRVDRIVKCVEAAARARAAGQLDVALSSNREAEQLLGQLLRDDPNDAAHPQALGSILYEVGELHLIRGEPTLAADALSRAEAAYTSLGRHRFPAARLRLLVGDVRLRRARAYATCDRAASALVDAQAGVLALLGAWDGDFKHPGALDAARSLLWNAWVTVTVGDPDLAVASADSALRIYLQLASIINSRPQVAALHLPLFTHAARIASVVHAAHGRSDLAAQAGTLVTSAIKLNAPLPEQQTIRSAVTLAEALVSLNAEELRDQLTAPATECRIRIALERIDTVDFAPATAVKLAALSMQATDARVALRVALEAHAMFAGASEAGVQLMRRSFASYGPVWAELLHRSAERGALLGRAELVRDLGGWLSGVAAQLLPLAAVMDDVSRAATRRALVWQEGQMMAEGDSEAAESCSKMADAFR